MAWASYGSFQESGTLVHTPIFYDSYFGDCEKGICNLGKSPYGLLSMSTSKPKGHGSGSVVMASGDSGSFFSRLTLEIIVVDRMARL